jgi:hypothetical protein
MVIGIIFYVAMILFFGIATVLIEARKSDDD